MLNTCWTHVGETMCGIGGGTNLGGGCQWYVASYGAVTLIRGLSTTLGCGAVVGEVYGAFTLGCTAACCAATLRGTCGVVRMSDDVGCCVCVLVLLCTHSCCVAVEGRGLLNGDVHAVCCVKMPTSWCSASCWMLEIGQIGDANEGLLSACMRSRAAAMVASLDDVNGLVTWVGNHANVSSIRSALVPYIHTI
jgi:hypothetical protein